MYIFVQLCSIWSPPQIIVQYVKSVKIRNFFELLSFWKKRLFCQIENTFSCLWRLEKLIKIPKKTLQLKQKKKKTTNPYKGLIIIEQNPLIHGSETWLSGQTFWAFKQRRFLHHPFETVLPVIFISEIASLWGSHKI